MSNTREYKSDVFSMLMEYPENALQVYNVLNGTNHTDPSLVEIVTLDKGISLSIRNDAAFIIDYELTISEHQSSYNPNMPLRSLIYFSTTMQKRIIKKKQDIFGRSLIKIPLPHFVVFYNGIENRPEKEILKLSDAYEKASENPELEIICTVYNINPDKNPELLENCEVLYNYTFFVEKVREYGTMNLSIDEAVKKAIDYCINHDILKEFLEERGNEVLHVMTLDCTIEAREKLWKEQEEMMSKQIDDLSLQNAEQGKQLSEKEKQIDEQGKQLSEKEKQIDEQGKQLSEKENKINEQSKLIKALQEQIVSLQQKEK